MKTSTFSIFWLKNLQSLTCKVMYEVFDEVADDGIKNTQQYKDGHEQVDDIGRQVDSIPRGGYVALKEHGPVVFLVTNFQALPRHIHCCLAVLETAVNMGIHLIPQCHRCVE